MRVIPVYDMLFSLALGNAKHPTFFMGTGYRIRPEPGSRKRNFVRESEQPLTVLRVRFSSVVHQFILGIDIEDRYF